jgi:hypothetical protein
VALARVYNIDSGLAAGITIGSTTPGSEFTILTGVVAAGVECDISAIRVAAYSGSSASYPSNGTITWRLRKTATGGILPAGGTGAAATAAPIGQSTNAAVSSWYYSNLANATATFATIGTVVWEQTIPCTAGANWGEWFTPGFEINLGAAGAGTMSLTYEVGGGVTATNMNAMVGLVISE